MTNAYTNYKLIKSDYYEKQQKIYQSLIIWLIPFIGMIIVLTLLKEDDKITKNQTNKNNKDAKSYEFGSDMSGGASD